MKRRLLCLFAGILLLPCGVARAAAPLYEIALAAENLRTNLVTQRRDFHMHPELSGREERTARVVADRLRALGFDEVRTNVAHHGVVALLKGGKPGPVVAYRAEMDALPINETLDVPYRSLITGTKHACGHDAHTAIALGVAEILAKMRDQLPGTVKFIFQPSEEMPPPGQKSGASSMINEGALDNPRPDAIFGLHCTTEIDAGKIGVRSGAAQASADIFDLTIHGKTSYAANPEKGVDTILVAAECVSALQSIKSRRLSAFDPVILTIGTIHGGSKRHTIADEVKMEGTLRTFSEVTRAQVFKLMRQTAQGICDAYGATFDLTNSEITSVVYNDPDLVEETLPTLRNIVGSANVVTAELRMGADDFSYYQQVIPGFYLRLGSGNKAKGIVAAAHTPEFDIDEDCLVVGTKTMAAILFDYLVQHTTK